MRVCQPAPVALKAAMTSGDKRMVDALRPLVGSITVEAMRAANYSVDRDTAKVTPAQAARGLSKARD